MVTPFLVDLRHVLSHDRLERYRPPGGSDLEMIGAYYWNVELCEALYTTLGALEIALRNTISSTLTQTFGRSDWYNEPRFLQKREASGVFSTRFDLELDRKQVLPGRVVSGQTFGFWTSILSKGYKRWSDNNRALIKAAFPHAPIQLQYQTRVHERMNAIRLFRNRVFHYEFILDGIVLQNGARVPLAQIYAEIIEAIGWVSPTFQAATQTFDRFPGVHTSGSTAVEGRIKLHLGIP